MLKTPLGSRHRSHWSATACPTPGVYLLGLWTTQFPINNADAENQQEVSKG